jgi:RHS repeat-associated protein
VGANHYVWDNAGNLKQRTVAGATENLTWNTEERLTSVTGPSGTTSFVYDVDGTRLLRKSPQATTLYFAGEEITVATGSSTATAVRSYSIGGRVVATRTPSGVSYLATGDDGSVEAALPSGAAAPSGTRTYKPYGQVRNKTGSDFATNRGFLGQVEDSSTQLSYLNARYYDPSTGIFASADPVSDTSQQKSLNPYTYASGNPETMSDPSGLYSSYTHGLEASNGQLRSINKSLIADIGRLGGQIKELQGIVRQQQKVINDLVDRVEAMDAIIRQQQTIITQLQDRVRWLVGVVNAQAREIGRLRSQVAFWKGRAEYWRGRAIYWHGQAMSYKFQAAVWKGIALAPAPAFHSTFQAREGGLYPPSFHSTFQAREGGLYVGTVAKMGGRPSHHDDGFSLDPSGWTLPDLTGGLDFGGGLLPRPASLGEGWDWLTEHGWEVGEGINIGREALQTLGEVVEGGLSSPFIFGIRDCENLPASCPPKEHPPA